MSAPMLVPATTEGRTPYSSSARSTPIWAKPLRPPPPSTSAVCAGISGRFLIGCWDMAIVFGGSVRSCRTIHLRVHYTAKGVEGRGSRVEGRGSRSRVEGRGEYITCGFSSHLATRISSHGSTTEISVRVPDPLAHQLPGIQLAWRHAANGSGAIGGVRRRVGGRRGTGVGERVVGNAGGGGRRHCSAPRRRRRRGGNGT